MKCDYVMGLLNVFLHSLVDMFWAHDTTKSRKAILTQRLLKNRVRCMNKPSRSIKKCDVLSVEIALVILQFSSESVYPVSL